MRLALATALFMFACATDDAGLTDNDGFDDTIEDGKSDLSQASRKVVHRFADRRLFPEGGAFDPTDRAFYVGSLEHGSITRVDATGAESTFFAGTGEKDRYTLGMQVDAARRRLWVCTTKDSLGTIWIFDLATKARISSIDLTRANPVAACNDVLLDGDTALVSDRENTHIYRIDETRAVSVWAHDPLLGGALISLNSMVFTPDKSAVLTAVYLEPTLVRVSRRCGVAHRLGNRPPSRHALARAPHLLDVAVDGEHVAGLVAGADVEAIDVLGDQREPITEHTQPDQRVVPGIGSGVAMEGHIQVRQGAFIDAEFIV